MNKCHPLINPVCSELCKGEHIHCKRDASALAIILTATFSRDNGLYELQDIGLVKSWAETCVPVTHYYHYPYYYPYYYA